MRGLTAAMDCNKMLHEHRLWHQGLGQGLGGSLVCSKGSTGRVTLGAKLVGLAVSLASFARLPCADVVRWLPWVPAPLISGAGTSAVRWGDAATCVRRCEPA